MANKKHGIEIDGRLYDVFLTKTTLTTDFLMKYAERNEQGDLLYELIGCYFNQSMTIGMGESGTDFAELWDLLSSRSAVDGQIGHNVKIWTPMGQFTFLMYPASIKVNLKAIRDTDTGEVTEWEEMQLDFTANRPSRR